LHYLTTESIQYVLENIVNSYSWCGQQG